MNILQIVKVVSFEGHKTTAHDRILLKLGDAGGFAVVLEMARDMVPQLILQLIDTKACNTDALGTRTSLGAKAFHFGKDRCSADMTLTLQTVNDGEISFMFPRALAEMMANGIASTLQAPIVPQVGH